MKPFIGESAYKVLLVCFLLLLKIRRFFDCVSRLRGFFIFDEIESMSRFWSSNSRGVNNIYLMWEWQQLTPPE